MGDVWATSSIFLLSKTDGTSAILLKGTTTYILDDLGNIIGMFDASGAYFANARIKDLEVQRLVLAARVDLGFEGISFSSDSGTNQVSWTAGTIRYTNSSGTRTSISISSGSASWSSGVRYIYWDGSSGSLSSTTTQSTAFADGNVVIAQYRGGKLLDVTWGKRIVDTATVESNAITVGGAEVEASDTNITGTAEFPSLPTAWTTISSFSMTPDGGEVILIGTTDIFARTNTAGSDGRVEVGLFNNSTSTTVPLVSRERDFDIGAFEHADITLLWRETSVGTTARTYALKVRCIAGGGGGTGSCNSCTAREGSGISGINYKK
jgi:hypothetical protein